MVSVYDIKPAFQRLLNPVLLLLKKLGVKPDSITLSALLLSLLIGTAFTFSKNHPSLLFVVPTGLFIRMALNALDGMMATRFHMTTKKGEFLNEYSDIVSDLFIFIPLLHLEPVALYPVAAFIYLAIINELTGILGKSVCGKRFYNGPMGKSDRALVIGLYAITAYFSSWQNTLYSFYFFVVLCLLLLLSTGIRIKNIFKETGK